MKINKELKLFLIGLGILMVIGCSCCMNYNLPLLETMSTEDPLYYDKDTFKSIVYDGGNKNLSDSAMTSDYYKNLNPYANNEINTPGALPPPLPPLPPPNKSGPPPQAAEQGVKFGDIPQGQHDLYILKSQVVPPVCPACPVIEKDSGKKCQPCPPCGRCPEPSFTCKKVPNYKNMDETKLPGFLPRLANGGHHF